MITKMAQTDFELSNFLNLINQEVADRLEQNDSRGFREVAFTELITDYLTEAEETGNFQICTSIHHNKGGNRQRQINGYALWDDMETLDLFISDYRGDGSYYTMEKTKLNVSFNLVNNYLKYLRKGDFSLLEDSAAGTEFVSNLHEYYDQLQRIRLILLTDGIVKSTLPEVRPYENEDITVVHEIWDLQRIYQLWASRGKREPIEINMKEQFGQKIECLTVEQEADFYTAYLAIVPADLLAGLYNTYGTRLLEQNVRVYLQNLGKVNREMRKTILGSPGMFMAYNNGISATASEIRFETDSNGKKFINYLKGLQIVNGGQTTSSIYYAKKKDRADLSKIHVQMKITLVHDESKTDKLVSLISKYANSQNKVSEIDLTSNQPFQIKLEELSRTSWAAAINGGHLQTRWFYERVKGQYKEELNKEHTVLRKAQFKAKNPSGQVVRKEEFAKYRNSWNLMPFWVARGSQKNYLHFVSLENSSDPVRLYYKDTMAVAILFKAAEDLYGKKPNSMGDLRYLVVPYTISWLNYFTAGKLNLSAIWEKQSVSDNLRTLLRAILLKINDFFQQKPEEFTLISEWGKREECWKALTDLNPGKMGLSFETIDAELTDSGGQTTLRENNQILGVPVSEWEILEAKGRIDLGFDLFQINTIRNVIRRLKMNQAFSEQLTEQAMNLLNIYRQAGNRT